MRIIKYLIIISISVFFAADFVEAATLNLNLSKNVFVVGDQFTAEVRIDTEGAGINAAQTNVTFSKNILQVTSVDRIDSAFNFWLEEPSYSNEEGIISFLGGSTGGLEGKSLKVINIVFKIKSAGEANINFVGAAVISSDGSGANVLSGTKGVSITATPTGEIIVIPPPLTKPPVISKNLPIKPEVNIALYPDPQKWYNVSAGFSAKWDLPLDIISAAAVINKDPNFNPRVSEGLFDNKDFPALGDGVWYLHVRFKNNIDWGQTNHYRFAIDTEPPVAFKVNVLEGLATDNPAPTLEFETSDALSSLKEYQIKINDKESVKISASEFEKSFKFSLQSPGKKQVTVKAVDFADNSAVTTFTIDIIPIQSPNIAFLDREIISNGDEKVLTVNGTALSDVDILVKLYLGETLIAEGTSRSDDKGNWGFTYSQPLRIGTYKLTVQGKDSRGALSELVESPDIKVITRPIIQIGRFSIGPRGAIGVLLALLAAGFAGGVWFYNFYKKREGKLASRISFAESEITKIFKLINDDIKNLYKALETSVSTDDEYALKRLQENVQKMEEYIKKGIEKISR